MGNYAIITATMEQKRREDRRTGPRSRVLRTAAVLLLLAVLAGCAALEARKRLQEYDDYFAPLVGTARQADMTKKFGAPARRDKVGTAEIWYYHIAAKDPRGSDSRGGFEGGYAVGADSDIYDDLTLEFDAKGILKSWRGYIQR
jgi:outer membrane protein assembly factor BamE (lipoprotein component of BamABCDE complex)